MVSRSKGLIVLKFITSQEIFYYCNYSAASIAYFTFLEKLTIETSLPYIIIFAFPIHSIALQQVHEVAVWVAVVVVADPACAYANS